ncbi:hypothetical protein [Hymenobacter sp. IS2118]
MPITLPAFGYSTYRGS